MNSNLSRVRAALPELILLLLFLVRLATSALVFRSPNSALWPDSHGYIELATSLLNGLRYSAGEGSTLDLVRAPGYPGFLAGAFSIAGENLGMVSLIQLGLGVGTGLLLYLVGFRTIGRIAGLISAFIYLISINSTFWALGILSETLFAFLLMLSFALIIHGFNSSNLAWPLMSGLVLGVAVLVRPIGLIILVPWTLFAAVALRQSRVPARPKIVLIGALIFGASLVVLPWAFRNYQKWGVFNVSTIGSRNLGRYQAPATLARAEGISLDEARDRIPSNQNPAPGEFRRQVAILLEYPVDYLIIHSQGTWRVFAEGIQPHLALFLDEEYRGSGLVVAFRSGDLQRVWDRLKSTFDSSGTALILLAEVYGLVVLILTYTLGLRGLVISYTAAGRLRLISIFAAAVALLLMIAPGPVGNARFRVPAEPFLAYLAGAAFSQSALLRVENSGTTETKSHE